MPVDITPTPIGVHAIQARPVVSVTYKLTSSGRPLAEIPEVEVQGSATPEKTSFA